MPRVRVRWLGLVVGAVFAVFAVKARGQTPRPELVTPFRPLRIDESYEYLRDSVRHGWWQPLKYIPLGAWSTLSLGGEDRKSVV